MFCLLFSQKIKDLCKLKHFTLKMGKSWLEQSFTIWTSSYSMLNKKKDEVCPHWKCSNPRLYIRVCNDERRLVFYMRLNSCNFFAIFIIIHKVVFFRKKNLFLLRSFLSNWFKWFFFSLSFIVSVHRFDIMFSSMLPHTH